jgi:hypothetical protein
VQALVAFVSSAVLAVAAVSAGDVNVSATVKTLSPTLRLVHIVNRDKVAYREFVVQSINVPIRAASKPCSVERDLSFSGTRNNWRYRARCKEPLAARRTLDIRVTTATTVKLVVFVVVGRVYTRIDK